MKLMKETLATARDLQSLIAQVIIMHTYVTAPKQHPATTKPLPFCGLGNIESSLPAWRTHLCRKSLTRLRC